MQGAYPKQDAGAEEATKCGSGVQECRESVSFDAFDRLRVVFGSIYRTTKARPGVRNAPGWGLAGVGLLPYLLKLTP
jgi:hypothetical protein